MASRPTIADLSTAAGVSLSTVDRVLTGRAQVKRETAERVLAAAERIGFYAANAIKERIGADRPTVNLTFLLQQARRPFYRNLAVALETACRQCASAQVAARIVHMEDLSPDAVADHIAGVGKRCHAMAAVAAEHPLVIGAINALATEGVHCFGLISPISSADRAGYVGLDHWKVGRTAGWAFATICKAPGRLGIMVGSHRYRNQALNESGFRSYMREHAGRLELLEPMITFEDKRVAAELTRDLLRREPGIAGIFVSGGGISGVIEALRESGRGNDIVTIGYELTTQTRAALIDGTIDLVISHPLDTVAATIVEAMVAAVKAGEAAGALPSVNIPFAIFTPENI